MDVVAVAPAASVVMSEVVAVVRASGGCVSWEIVVVVMVVAVAVVVAMAVLAVLVLGSLLL